jgi:YggT family protein
MAGESENFIFFLSRNHEIGIRAARVTALYPRQRLIGFRWSALCIFYIHKYNWSIPAGGKNVLYVILDALNLLIWVIVTCIFVRSILSWFPGATESKVGSILFTLTEPVLSPIRKVFMKFEFARSSPIDFSPVVAILLLFLIQSFISVLINL